MDREITQILQAMFSHTQTETVSIALYIITNKSNTFIPSLLRVINVLVITGNILAYIV